METAPLNTRRKKMGFFPSFTFSGCACRVGFRETHTRHQTDCYCVVVVVSFIFVDIFFLLFSFFIFQVLPFEVRDCVLFFNTIGASLSPYGSLWNVKRRCYMRSAVCSLDSILISANSLSDCVGEMRRESFCHSTSTGS